MLLSILNILLKMVSKYIIIALIAITTVNAVLKHSLSQNEEVNLNLKLEELIENLRHLSKDCAVRYEDLESVFKLSSDYIYTIAQNKTDEANASFKFLSQEITNLFGEKISHCFTDQDMNVNNANKQLITDCEECVDAQTPIVEEFFSIALFLNQAGKMTAKDVKDVFEACEDDECKQSAIDVATHIYQSYKASYNKFVVDYDSYFGFEVMEDCAMHSTEVIYKKKSLEIKENINTCIRESVCF